MFRANFDILDKIFYQKSVFFRLDNLRFKKSVLKSTQIVLYYSVVPNTNLVILVYYMNCVNLYLYICSCIHLVSFVRLIVGSCFGIYVFFLFTNWELRVLC
jgi:hypothetical protein